MEMAGQRAREIQAAGFWRDCMAPARHRIATVQPTDPWSNALAKTQRVVDARGIVGLIGGRGNGKTQIAVEVMRHVCTKTAKPAKYYLAAEVFMAIRDSYRKDAPRTEAETIHQFIRPYLLVLDELAERAGTDAETRALTTIIDKRYQLSHPTILVANAEPADFRKLVGESVWDRMQEDGGGYVVCDWPSFRGATK